MIAEDDEPGDQSRLSPIRPPPEEVTEEGKDDDVKVDEDEDMAVPIRDVPHEPMDQDLIVPLQDAPGPSTLKRKPSVSTFSGLPAPSPLRKSMRMSHEPSNGSFPHTLAHTPGAALGGAGKRTSWLTQAKQAKALDMTITGKRVSSRAEGSGSSATTAPAPVVAARTSKSKSGEPFGLGFAFPSSESVAVVENEKTQETETTESEALAFLRGKRKATSLEDDTTRIIQQQSRPQVQPVLVPASALDPMDDMTVPITDNDSEEHTLHRLKKTVEGARAGKSMGKSLGGNAAAELAEARAKAEARVAQRNKSEGDENEKHEKNEENEETGMDGVAEPSTKHARQSGMSAKGPSENSLAAEEGDGNRRMSVSDLMSGSEQPKPQTGAKTQTADLSTSTTPPNSPPAALSHASAAVAAPPPVFSKPPTVFVPPPPRQSSTQTSTKRAPAPSSSKEPAFKLPVANPFSLPVASNVGIPASISSQKSAPALSAQSSKASLFSDAVFDKEDSAPAWMTATQDTEFSQNLAGQSQKPQEDDDEDMDEDDSWHVDEQFKANQMWTPFGFGSAEKDDTMTWSTLPSRSTSQKGGDTAPIATENLGEAVHKAANDMLREEADRAKESELQTQKEEAKGPASDLDSDLDKARGEIDEEDLQTADMEIDDEYAGGVDTELEDIVAAGKSTISLVKVCISFLGCHV